MDEILRDLSRLNLIYQMPIAQEKLALNNHLKDFVYYYFSRFVSNLTHLFKDFSQTEIGGFYLEHHGKLELMYKHPSFTLDDMIVPIPRGMINSYKVTMEELLKILRSVSPDTIHQDLESIFTVMGTGKIKSLSLPAFTKKQFDGDKDKVGKLFGKVGLTHSTARHCLVSKSEIRQVTDALRHITDGYYSKLMTLGPILTKIETKHADVKWSENDRMRLASYLMSMAYRLSILAVVMDHIQEIEHAFVKDLNILLKKMH